ncbi:MAG TPA: hypothetical protein VK636_04330 [Gemmatimonadaceae bacterium]|nr:hypothetical protein [Gemmatimonadaceae bacterium]
MRPPQELLYDSEASLRLVDHAIEELSASGAELDQEARGFLEHVMAQPGGLADLSRTLLRAYAETAGIVARFRESAGMLDAGGIDKLQLMHGRLAEVTSATETATTDILDGVNRATELVEKLDVAPKLSDAERHVMAASLREELGNLASHLQFQDITSQQLAHIATLLDDMRTRISQVVAIFAPPSVTFAKDAAAPETEVMKDARTTSAAVLAVASAAEPEQQAVADAIFAIRAGRKTA